MDGLWTEHSARRAAGYQCCYSLQTLGYLLMLKLYFYEILKISVVIESNCDVAVCNHIRSI